MKSFFLRKRKKTGISLTVIMVFLVFFTMLASAFIVSSIFFTLARLQIFNPFHRPDPIIPVAYLLLFCVLLGSALTAIVSRRTLKPLQKIIDATYKVATGDFTVQLETGSVPEMERLTASFNTMVRELSSIETLRNDFINNFSHEIKTPTVSIRGFAKLLRDRDLSEDTRDEYLEIIIQESERLSGLATSTLNMSKLENTGILTDRQAFRVDEQVRRAAALMEPRWREKNITVILEMDEAVISSNEELLGQVWTNLFDNAIKFTNDSGRISVSLTCRENEIEFRITDDGIGMDEQTRLRVFDKFYQGDKSHSGAGNGLGLAIVKQIVVAICSGRIEVESGLGIGSTFTVFLPVRA